MNKERYIKYTKKHFKGKSKKVVLNQIKLFYKNTDININNNYNIGDNIMLKKGTFIHGINYSVENINWILNNGFIASEFNGYKKPKKYFNNVGFWNIKKDVLLSEYIKLYSGITIEYNINRNNITNKKIELISIDNIINKINELNNNETVWSWKAEQTKEIRFIPSLASDKRQLAFILDMDNDYAEELKYNDIFNKSMTKVILKYFVIDKIIDKFMNEQPNALTTDRESGIIFGLPSELICGLLVGRKLEKDIKNLKYLKDKFPNCYICNLDGKMIY